MQTRFPDSWTDDDVLISGTAVINSAAPATMIVGDYNKVTIVIFTDTNGNGTICPDYIQDAEGMFEVE